MRRDWDLIREILLTIEAADDPSDEEVWKPLECDEAKFHYHLGLLWKAGLIEAFDMSAANSTQYLPTGLTWEGHDFLDGIRNDTVWTRTKTAVSTNVGTVSFEILKAVAGQVAKGMLGLTP